jgi:hypothetical protein
MRLWLPSEQAHRLADGPVGIETAIVQDTAGIDIESQARNRALEATWENWIGHSSTSTFVRTEFSVLGQKQRA